MCGACMLCRWFMLVCCVCGVRCVCYVRCVPEQCVLSGQMMCVFCLSIHRLCMLYLLNDCVCIECVCGYVVRVYVIMPTYAITLGKT